MGWRSDGFAGDEHGQQNVWHESDDESDDEYDELRGNGSNDDMGDTPVHAVAAREYFDRAVADFDDSSLETIVVPGSGVSMGEPLLRRRERPLTLRIAVLARIACILVTGIFASTPLGADKASAESPFQVLASSMVLNHQLGYFYYTAEPGDTLDAVARRFHVQVGGTYELNNLYAGEEFAIGTAYKIPTPTMANISSRSTSPVGHRVTLAIAASDQTGGIRWQVWISRRMRCARQMAGPIRSRTTLLPPTGTPIGCAASSSMAPGSIIPA